jgi:hypothetical protein
MIEGKLDLFDLSYHAIRSLMRSQASVQLPGSSKQA